jgi:STE24 endopeptidase
MHLIRIAFRFLLLAVLLGSSAAVLAAPETELPPGLQIPEAARPGPGFDVDKATQAYLDLLSPDQKAQSDAYFEGGYWLQLWGLLYGLVVAWILLRSGLSRRMRDIGQRISKRPFLSTMIYAALWLVLFSILSWPLGIYTGYFREHAYGLATQTFGEWSLDELKELLLSLVFIPPIIALLYAAVRKAGARWWVWAGAGTFVMTLFFMMIAPVYLDPVFNDYKPLRQGDVREQVLSLARANLIPTDNVVEFDASRQTTRISANVSGFLGTTRVALNDNLLDRTSEPEILAVMGHEMGHYVLNHGLRLVIYLSLVLTIGFWVVHCLFDKALARWGARFGVEGRTDPAGLPLALAILSLFMFLATPLTNSIVRQAEAEADAYGINSAQEPNGFAMAAMRLSTYRKIHPGPLEEIIFYDHPSGYARVHRSMSWLKEHQDNKTANAPLPVVPSVTNDTGGAVD